MLKFAVLMLLVASAVPSALALGTTEQATLNSREGLPGLAGAARFASLQAGGDYPSGDADVTMREGLGENLPFPGSDYLGMGYNALYGNPDGDGEKMEDPGWRGPVLRIPWCQNAECLSSDMLNLRPTDKSGSPIGWAHREVACEMSRKVTTMKRMSDYSSSLSVDADVNVAGGLFGVSAAFSASAGYDEFRQEVAEGTSTRFQIKSYCTKFTMGLPQKNYFHVGIRDELFNEARDGAPETPRTQDALDKWFYLFDTFGTHVAIEVDLGGKMVMTSSVEENSESSTKTTDMAAAVAASFDGAVYSGSGSLSTKASSSAMDAFEESKKKSHVSIFGGMPPADNPVGSTEGFGEWAATVSDRPMPVKYKLCPLDTCAGVNAADYRYAVEKYAEAKAGLQRTAHVPIPAAMPSGSKDWGGGDRLFCGQRMYRGDYIFSKDGEYRAGFDLTFNFMVWKKHESRWKVHWQARTGTESGSGVDEMNWNCKHRTDLYAVLTNFCRLDIRTTSVKVWSSDNGGHMHPCHQHNTGGMILANDGHLYILTFWGKGVWKSGSNTDKDQANGERWEYENAVKDKGLEGALTTDKCGTFDKRGTYSYEGRESPESC